MAFEVASGVRRGEAEATNQEGMHQLKQVEDEVHRAGVEEVFQADAGAVRTLLSPFIGLTLT